MALEVPPVKVYHGGLFRRRLSLASVRDVLDGAVVMDTLQLSFVQPSGYKREIMFIIRH